MCNFNPMTGEEEPMNEDCRKSAEALDMAIKALEQQPCEDTISRQAAIGAIMSELTYAHYPSWYAERLEQLPSVTPTNKKCHNVNPDYAECDQFVCSNCGIELQDWHRVERDEDGDITYHEYEFKYCPNCGADIRGEQDE